MAAADPARVRVTIAAGPGTTPTSAGAAGAAGATTCRAGAGPPTGASGMTALAATDTDPARPVTFPTRPATSTATTTAAWACTATAACTGPSLRWRARAGPARTPMTTMSTAGGGGPVGAP